MSSEGNDTGVYHQYDLFLFYHSEHSNDTNNFSTKVVHELLQNRQGPNNVVLVEYYFGAEIKHNLSIKRAVSLINDIDASRFPRLLSRILQKLHLRDERSFTEDEEEKLEVALGIEGRDLQLVLETTAFILEQAAYHIAKPTVLSQQLQNIGLTEDKVAVFVKAWTAGGKGVVEKLRQNTLAPNQLEEVNWRLNLQMAQASKTKMKTPNAMFELVVSGEKEDDTKKKVRMEFSHDELYDFYNQLETIQGQLDSLS